MPHSYDSTLRWNGVADTVAYTTSSVQSAAISAHIFDVRIVCTSDAWINIGANPTAADADNNLFMPAGVVEYFHVTPGQKIAVIQDSAGGDMIVAEMTR